MPASALRCVLLSVACLLAACTGEPQATPAPKSVDDTLCLAADGTVEPALASAVAATRARPQRADAWIAVGNAWLERAFARASSGEMVQVAACANAARGRDAFEVEAGVLEASVALNAHRFEEALQLSDLALALAPGHVGAWGIRSDALLELGRYREAADATRRQMQLWPGAAAQARAAHLRWLHGDVEGAKRALVAALRGRDARTPAFNAWLWSEIARIYLHEGEYADAAAMYQRSLAELAAFPPALLGAARAALGLGDAAAARGFAGQALAIAPSVEAAIALGDAHAALDDRAAAESAWQRAEDLGRRGDVLGYARFLNERGRDPARALRLLEAMAGARDSLEFRDALAWTRHRNGDCAGAAATLAPLLALGVRDARVLLHGAAIARVCGDADVARQRLRLALQLDTGADAVAAREVPALFATTDGVVAR